VRDDKVHEGKMERVVSKIKKSAIITFCTPSLSLDLSFPFQPPVFIHFKKRGHLTDNRIQTNRNRCTESRFILRAEGFLWSLKANIR
jgi:hypothetical protein